MIQKYPKPTRRPLLLKKKYYFVYSQQLIYTYALNV